MQQMANIYSIVHLAAKNVHYQLQLVYIHISSYCLYRTHFLPHSKQSENCCKLKISWAERGGETPKIPLWLCPAGTGIILNMNSNAKLWIKVASVVMNFWFMHYIFLMLVNLQQNFMQFKHHA